MTKQTKINSLQAETNLSNDFSLKELFERVVVLETKLDLISSTSNKTAKYFKYLAFLIVFVEAVNFVLNILLIMEWH